MTNGPDGKQDGRKTNYYNLHKMDLNKQPNRQVIYLKETYKNIKKKKKLSKKKYIYLLCSYTQRSNN